MKNTNFQHLLGINIAVLCISTSGVLGRYIAMAPPILIAWRTLLALSVIGVYCVFSKINLRFSFKKEGGIFTIASLFMALHWVTYFYALQYANVALGMLSLYTYPVMTAVLEPIFLKTKWNLVHLILACLVLVGVYLLLPEIDFQNHQTKGVLFGIASAFFYAIRNLIMKKKVAEYHPSMLMFYQMLGMLVFLCPMFYFYDSSPVMHYWPGILTLAVLTTAIGHTLMVKSLQYFSASAASILSGIQPIYGILLAYVFLNEMPSTSTIFGGTIIILAISMERLLSSVFESKKS